MNKTSKVILLKKLKIKAILIGIGVSFVMNVMVSLVMFSGFGKLVSDDITIKIIIFIILSMFMQASIPAYIATIVAKRDVIFHSIILGVCFVFMNLIGLIFENGSMGFWVDMLFCAGLFLFSLLGGMLRKIEIVKLLKR